MKKIISIIVLQVIVSTVFAQMPSYNWLINFGNSLYDDGKSIAVDDNGNVYVCGSINGIVDLDPSAGTYNITSNGGSNDFFIAKYDSSGNIIWGFRRGSSSYDVARKILLTSTNDLVVVGDFGGTFDFDPSGAGNTSLNAGTNTDGFIAKYDSAGNFIWAFNLGDQANYDVVGNADLDPDDNVYVIGYFQGTVDFNPGTGTANLSSTNGAAFIAKYDSAGGYDWAFEIESNSSITGIGISVDPLSNVYISGAFTGTADFNPSTGVFNLSSVSADDIFFAKYSAASTFIWAYELGSGGDDVGVDINAKSLGRVYLTGFIDGAVDFDVSAGSYLVFTSGALNGYLASYDVNAALQWAFGLGQPGGGSQGLATITDASGNAYLTGAFSGTIDFDPSANVDTISAPLTASSGFIAKYSNTGVYQYAQKLESSNHTYPFDMVVDLTNNIIISGRFGGTCDFDPSVANNTNTVSNGLDDGFIAKYSSTATGINEISFENNYRVYPNPASSRLYVQSPFTDNQISIINSTGAIIRELKTSAFVTEINLDDFSKGIYLIRINNNSASVIKKVIKN